MRSAGPTLRTRRSGGQRPWRSRTPTILILRFGLHARTGMEPKFHLGQIVATPGVLAAFERSGKNPACFIRRHVLGDWGDLCADDIRENEFSVQNEFRLLSAYHLKDGTK